MRLLRPIAMCLGVGLLLAVGIAWSAAAWGWVTQVAMAPARPSAVDLPPPPPAVWRGRVPDGWGPPVSIVEATGPGLRIQQAYTDVTPAGTNGAAVIECGWPLAAMRSTVLSPNLVSDTRRVAYFPGLLLESTILIKVEWHEDPARVADLPPGASGTITASGTIRGRGLLPGLPRLSTGTVTLTRSQNLPRRLPLEPIWVGLIADTAIFALLIGGCVLAISGARRRWRRRRGLCVGCGYPTGAGQRCPECGRAAGKAVVRVPVSAPLVAVAP